MHQNPNHCILSIYLNIFIGHLLLKKKKSPKQLKVSSCIFCPKWQKEHGFKPYSEKAAVLLSECKSVSLAQPRAPGGQSFGGFPIKDPGHEHVGSVHIYRMREWIQEI